MQCIYCGNYIHSERVDLGYNYCTGKSCAKQGFKPRTVIAMALPKSTFLVQGFADDNPRVGLVDGVGARRW